MRRLTAILIAATATLAALASPAAAAANVRIREASLSAAGDVRLVITVGGDAAGASLASSDVVVTDGGRRVGAVSVAPLIASQVRAAVALAIDESGSTAGRAIADAKAAATTFVERLDTTVPVAVVSFGDRAVVRSAATTDRDATKRAIGQVTARGSTALYDGVALAAQQLRGVGGLHSIVVFSDGRDSSSAATLAGAIGAAKAVDAPITAVALATKDSDAAALARLAADTRGSVVQVGASAGLADAFRTVAAEISSQFVVTYKATGGARDLEIGVTVRGATDRIVVSNPRTVPAAEPEPVAPPAPPVGLFASKTGLYVGIAAAFGFLALFGGMLVVRTTKTEGGRVLDRGIRALSRRGRRREADDEDKPSSAIAGLGRAADEVLQQMAGARRFEEKLQTKLDRAGWPMRASEFLVMQTGAGLAGLVLGWVLLGRWYLGIAVAAAGAAMPSLALSNRVAKRQAAFLDQLPDTLQLLAGSLQAGYGFLQAVDTLVKECPEPTRGEFTRVLTEARLGMPPEDALTAMAERIGNDDFRWVVLAISIQRQVGGNLAELLKTVAGTLREREGVRRQIKTLSAEGRLSAVILGLMPFAITGYLFAVNPGYITKLFVSSNGRILVAAAAGLMGLGGLWLRKIIRIDV